MPDELQRVRDRVHDLANAMHILQGDVKAHVAGCEKQGKHVNEALAELKKGQGKSVLTVIGAQGAILLAIFVAWLAKGGHV